MAVVLTSQWVGLKELEKIYLEKPILEILPELLNNQTNLKNDNLSTAETFLAAHALGFGPAVPPAVTRLALVLQLQTLLLSEDPNNQPGLLLRLLAFYNREIWPVISEQALPASQLTQLCLPLLGKGKVSFQGYDLNAADVLDIFSWEPLPLSVAEVDNFIRQNAFTYAYLLHNLFRFKPLLNWLEYLIQVFDQLSDEKPASLPAEWKKLVDAFNNTLYLIEQNFPLSLEKQRLNKVRDAVLDLLVILKNITGGIYDMAYETNDNLTSNSEPPATTSFKLTAELIQSLQKQLNLLVVSLTDTIILPEDMRILHQEFSKIIDLTEQLIRLSFWSVTQVGKVFSLTPGNITLSTYYHSPFFVSKEMVSDQLQKISEFIRLTSPVSLT